MGNSPEPSGKARVQSVDRALMLVEILAKENRELSLTELSKLAGRPKSTVHGLLVTLGAHHYVEQSSTTGNYRLGIRLFELGNIVARSWNIREVALPVMQQLSSQLNEMVQLATDDQGEVLYLDKVDSTHIIRIVSDIGTRLPMHCSGLGKVLLAAKPPREVRWILNKKGMQRMTSHTITTLEEMNKELEKIRQQGYAVDDREIMDSLRCVAAPIRNKDGQVQFAISVSGLSNNMVGTHYEKAIQSVLSAAEKISYAIGYRGETPL